MLPILLVLLELKQHKAAEPAWFQQTHPDSALLCIAYFSMEFMLSEALPIYSGGRGNVAGDQLKAASDLGFGRGRRSLDGSVRQGSLAWNHGNLRPNLLPHDPERLLRILNNPERPVQLILAGKAHPADQAGQALIKEWTHFIRRTESRSRWKTNESCGSDEDDENTSV